MPINLRSETAKLHALGFSPKEIAESIKGNGHAGDVIDIAASVRKTIRRLGLVAHRKEREDRLPK